MTTQKETVRCPYLSKVHDACTLEFFSGKCLLKKKECYHDSECYAIDSKLLEAI
jgi:hypothetical protein